MDKEVFTIKEFCQRYGISRSAFYKLRGLGTGPQFFKAGDRVLISKRSADAWILRMESEAAAKSASG